MAEGHAEAVMEQRIIMRFLVKEGVKPSEIYQRVTLQYGEETVSKSTLYEWCKQFKDGREVVADLPGRGGVRASCATAVNSGTIAKVKELVMENRRMTVRELSTLVGISTGSIETILHEHLNLSKVSARWVPRQLTVFHKEHRAQISKELLARYEEDGEAFLERIVTSDETWVHHFTPESKESSKQWKHSTSPTPKKFRMRPSAGKVMASVFWDFRGIIHVDYLPKSHTINAAYYQGVLKDVHAAIKRKRPGLITKGVIFQQDNARPHTAQSTMALISELGWEVIPHPPYSPDLAPSDFHLFGPLKKHLSGTHFETDEGVKAAVRIWLRGCSKEFYAQAFTSLVERWEKCVRVGGDYVEK